MCSTTTIVISMILIIVIIYLLKQTKYKEHLDPTVNKEGVQITDSIIKTLYSNNLNFDPSGHIRGPDTTNNYTIDYTSGELKLKNSDIVLSSQGDITTSNYTVYKDSRIKKNDNSLNIDTSGVINRGNYYIDVTGKIRNTDSSIIIDTDNKVQKGNYYIDSDGQIKYKDNSVIVDPSGNIRRGDYYINTAGQLVSSGANQFAVDASGFTYNGYRVSTDGKLNKGTDLNIDSTGILNYKGYTVTSDGRLNRGTEFNMDPSGKIIYNGVSIIKNNDKIDYSGYGYNITSGILSKNPLGFNISGNRVDYQGYSISADGQLVRDNIRIEPSGIIDYSGVIIKKGTGNNIDYIGNGYKIIDNYVLRSPQNFIYDPGNRLKYKGYQIDSNGILTTMDGLRVDASGKVDYSNNIMNATMLPSGDINNNKYKIYMNASGNIVAPTIYRNLIFDPSGNITNLYVKSIKLSKDAVNTGWRYADSFKLNKNNSGPLTLSRFQIYNLDGTELSPTDYNGITINSTIDSTNSNKNDLGIISTIFTNVYIDSDKPAKNFIGTEKSGSYNEIKFTFASPKQISKIKITNRRDVAQYRLLNTKITFETLNFNNELRNIELYTGTINESITPSRSDYLDRDISGSCLYPSSDSIQPPQNKLTKYQINKFFLPTDTPLNPALQENDATLAPFGNIDSYHTQNIGLSDIKADIYVKL